MSDYPLNDEVLTQTNETVFDVAKQAVNLAVALLRPTPPLELIGLAKDILLKYADWEHIDLPDWAKRELMIRNYGEEEAQAIWVKEQPANHWFTVEDIAGKDDRELYKYLCELEHSSREDGAVLVSSMTSEKFMWELKG
ncbi:MAG: hypothetical protein AUF65_01325 [Chloroflexi bacterium 13_1_20CM_50_12]|nr:MAG: hypothetical protein AUF65_01325 [Chloroflexi bacterium 13_1_20CM_50_12]